MNTPTLYMLIGVPGSGKSTWIKNQKFDNALIASTDDIIERIAEANGQTYDELFRANYNDAQKTMNAQIGQAIIDSKDIVWDQCNLNEGSRRPKLSKFKNTNYRKVAVIFTTPHRKDHEKRLIRPGKTIPSHVLRSMINSLQYPLQEEGFDEVIFAKNLD